MRRFLPHALFFLALAVSAAWVVRQGETMPWRVASHFNAQGQPDDWMGKRQEVRFFLAASLGTALFVAGIGYALRFVPPRLLNVPHAAYWRAPEHYPRACRFLFRASLGLGAFVALWMAGLHGLVAAANRHVPVTLDGGRLGLLLFLLLAGLGGWIALLATYFSRPR